MKKILFIILCLAAFPFAADAQIGLGRNRNKTTITTDELDYTKPREYIIGGVSIKGAQFLDRNALISMTGLKEGDKIKVPGEDLSNVIRRLWKQGILGDVKISIAKIEGDRVFLELELKERARLSRWEFDGIPKGQGQTLSDKIKLLKGRVVTDPMIKNTQNKIREYYVDKGFYNVNVTIIPRKDSLFSNSNYVYLYINIDKGTKVKIDQLGFAGVEQIKTSKLRRKMKKTKQKQPGRIFTPSRFIPKEYEKDKESLIAYYNKMGYRNATIEKDSVYKINDKAIGIKINIHEGKKFFYRNINWTGNYVYADSTLQKVLGIKKGDVYNPEDLSQRLNFNQNGTDITSLYMDDGYLFFSIEPVELQVDEDSIDIEMRIFEGEQATINKVIVKGNTRTSDHVIMRELRTLPGQKFSRADLIRTQRELAQIGYFDPEKIGINPMPNMSDGTVDIVYTVEEKSSDQIELSGGWGGIQGPVGTVGLVFNNFSTRKMLDFKQWKPLPQGDGQRLALRVQANGRFYQNYSLTFTEPWFGGKKPHSFSVGASHAIQRGFGFANRNSPGSRDAMLKITNLSVSSARRLFVNTHNEYFTMSNSLSYNRYNVRNYGNFGGFTNGVSNNIALNVTVSRNSIDNPTYPSTGSAISLSMSATPPYSAFKQNPEYRDINERFKWAEYHKWMFDNSWFIPIAGGKTRKLVLNARMHMGFMGAYNNKLGITPFERFVLGGSGLTINNFLLGQEIIGLRGYADNAVVPLQPDGNGGYIYQKGQAEGGTIFNKFVLELRYPLSLNPSATIFLLGFAEGGNNWSHFADFNPFDLKRSVGVGARIFMPAFGMLGIDYGYGFDRIPGMTDQKKGQFHFTIGQQIR